MNVRRLLSNMDSLAEIRKGPFTISDCLLFYTSIPYDGVDFGCIVTNILSSARSTKLGYPRDGVEV